MLVRRNSVEEYPAYPVIICNKMLKAPSILRRKKKHMYCFITYSERNPQSIQFISMLTITSNPHEINVSPFRCRNVFITSRTTFQLSTFQISPPTS